MKYEILEWMSHGYTSGFGVLINDGKKRYALSQSTEEGTEVISKKTRKEAILVAKEYIHKNK